MALFADYLTISGISESESRVKGSRFIGIALPCVTESDIQSNLSEVSRRYPNATHYCYAAVYGGTLRTEKSSDNGEPSGTAAKPILSVIKGRELTDTMVVVVRYFGGTLLGTGGLVHAYTQSATDSIECASIVKRQACAIFRIVLSYADLNAFNAKCRGMCAVPPEIVYEETVSVTAAVPAGRAEDFVQSVADATERRARSERIGDGYR